MSDKLSVGRRLHYVLSNGECRPADVVKVIDDQTANVLISFDFLDSERSESSLLHGWAEGIRIVPDSGVLGSLHWPEKV